MPRRRYIKLSCKCSHGKSIHAHTEKSTACNYPACGCTKYRLAAAVKKT